MNTTKFAGIVALGGFVCLVAAAFVGGHFISDWLVVAAEVLLAAAGAIMIGYVAIGVFFDVVLEGLDHPPGSR
jgi:hypothetical protein